MNDKQSRKQRAQQVHGWMGGGELDWLYENAVGKRLVIELGSWCGKSSIMLAVADELICVDTWQGDGSDKHNEAIGSGLNPRKEWERNLKPEIDAGKVAPYVCDLYSGEDILFELLEGCADMVFIDAAHDRDSVATDIRTARRLLKPGGLLCGHDYQFEGVNEAVNALVPKHENPVKSIWVQA